MAKKAYAKAEKMIVSLFEKEGKFIWNDQPFLVEKVGKPRPQGKGECKTDVYVKGVHNNLHKELKISIKLKHTYEFQESKISAERAEAIFGENWKNIVKETSLSIQDEFAQLPLMYIDQKGNTKANSVTMGWRLEITNKPRRLSAPICLTHQEIRDSIYKGINLPHEKKHAVVKGDVIENAGVAEYLLLFDEEEIHSVEDVMNHLQLIDSMEVPPTYLTFISNNYRMKEKKIDGARPLAVYVDWKLENGIISPSIKCDQPLTYKGKERIPLVTSLFQQLQCKLPEELHEKKHFYVSHHLFKKEKSA